MVMKTRNIPFYQSACFLQPLLNSYKNRPDPEYKIENRNSRSNSRLHKIRSNPISIGSILERAAVPRDGSCTDNCKKMNCRVEKLETEIGQLKYQLDQLKKFAIEIVAGKK
jgi:hypothetical protein